MTTLAAEFYPVPRKGFGWLDIVSIDRKAGERHQVEMGIKVANKREARKVAAERGATPWNF